MEIERRFLIRDVDKVKQYIKQYANTKKSITQDYIYSDKLTAIRKRKIEKDESVKYVYTVKTGRKGFSVNEFEEEISLDTYNSLKIDPNRATIQKDRYVIPYIDNLKIELDIFHGEYEGIIFAEIEYKDEEQAIKTVIPDWFDKEIGKTVSNDKMSRREVDFEKLLKE